MLAFRRAVLALAMASRRTADEFGTFDISGGLRSDDLGPAETDEIPGDLFEGGENVRLGSPESVENLGEPTRECCTGLFL